jgi:hypothetical protein
MKYHMSTIGPTRRASCGTTYSMLSKQNHTRRCTKVVTGLHSNELIGSSDAMGSARACSNHVSVVIFLPLVILFWSSCFGGSRYRAVYRRWFSEGFIILDSRALFIHRRPRLSFSLNMARTALIQFKVYASLPSSRSTSDVLPVSAKCRYDRFANKVFHELYTES